MKFRKLTSLALVAVLAVSCLAGCGGKKGGERFDFFNENRKGQLC